VNGRIGEACAAPPQMFDKVRADRPAYRACEPPEQRYRGDGAARFPSVNAAERGKRGIIEAGSHAAADEDPRREIPDEVLRRSKQHQPDGNQHSAECKNRAAAGFADRPPEPRRNRTGNQQPDRQIYRIIWGVEVAGAFMAPAAGRRQTADPASGQDIPARATTRRPGCKLSGTPPYVNRGNRCNLSESCQRDCRGPAN
jgi:hypothetical protein